MFGDSSAYFALSEARETSHTAAVAIMSGLEAEGRPLFTTNFVLAELHALLIRRVGQRIANRVLFELDNSRTTVVRVSARDERRAREILRQYDDKAWSLTDATSFAVMERLHIPRAFTFDSDFAQYGFTVLTAP